VQKDDTSRRLTSSVLLLVTAQVVSEAQAQEILLGFSQPVFPLVVHGLLGQQLFADGDLLVQSVQRG